MTSLIDQIAPQGQFVSLGMASVIGQLEGSIAARRFLEIREKLGEVEARADQVASLARAGEEARAAFSSRGLKSYLDGWVKGFAETLGVAHGRK